MNKKFNTFLFVMGATVFNIVVTLLTFVLLLMFYARFLTNVLPDEAHTWVLLVFFIAAIVVSFVVYRRILNKMLAKIKFEDYFDPIIVGRGRKPPPQRKG